MYNIKFPFIIIFCFFLFNSISLAIASDVYTISELKISASANNASEARIKAMEEGQIKAFNLLLNNLWLDKSPEFIASKISSMPRHNILSLIRDYSVSEEKISANSYKALLEVSFNSHLVNNLLQTTTGNTTTTNQHKVRLALKINSLDHLLQYKKKLANREETKNFRLVSLSTKRAVVEIPSPLTKIELERILARE